MDSSRNAPGLKTSQNDAQVAATPASRGRCSWICTTRFTTSLVLLIALAACSQAAISSPGKSNAAIQADMNSCNANSLTLHDRPVIDCLDALGDTIKYGDGTIPPYTSVNNNSKPATAADLQKQQSDAEAVLNRWQHPPTAGQSTTSAQNPSSPPLSSADSPTFITDSMYADLKEVVAPNDTLVFPNGIPNDDLLPVRAQSIGEYFLNRNSDFRTSIGSRWSVNKDLQDFIKAKRWLQLSHNLGNRISIVDSDIASCDFALSSDPKSARSEIADEKKAEQVIAEEAQRKLMARKKVGDCIAVRGGTGFLGLGSTIATVTGVSGDKLSWVAHLHRNGYSSPSLAGPEVRIWHAPEDFDREGTAIYNEVSLCE